MAILRQPSTRWNDELLESLRDEQDPIADKVIQDILTNHDLFQVNKLFDELVKNSDDIPKDLPQSVLTYFDDTEELPEWFNIEKIKLAQQIYAQFGPQVNMVLFCKSLPSCYACAKGVQVLHITGRMSKHGQSLEKFTRRLMETAQFILNVLEPKSFSEEGRAIRSMQKVRLMHAAIRFHLHHQSWSPELGAPINQEDMLGTMLSMSFQILEGLESLEIDFTPEERDAFAHYGRVLGYMIGIKDEVLPTNWEEAKECTAAILNHQVAPSPEGVELTKACLSFIAEIIPGKKYDNIPAVYSRHFIGDEIADMLEIPQMDPLKEHLYMKRTIFLNNLGEEITDRSIILRLITKLFNKALLNGMINYFNHDKEVHFYIPPDLHNNWKRIETWKTSWAIKVPFTERRIAWQREDSSIVNEIE